MWCHSQQGWLLERRRFLGSWCPKKDTKHPQNNPSLCWECQVFLPFPQNPTLSNHGMHPCRGTTPGEAAPRNLQPTASPGKEQLELGRSCGMQPSLLLSFSGMHLGISTFSFFEGFTRISSSFFLWDTLTQLLFFPGGTHTSLSPFGGCACTSLFTQDLPTHPLLGFFLRCTHASPPPFFAGSTPHLLLFLGCTPYLLLLLHSHISCFCGMNPWISSFFFRMHSSISSFVSHPQTLSIARTSCSQAHWELFPVLPSGSQQLNLHQRCSHRYLKDPTEDVFGKIKHGGDLGERAEQFPRLPFHAGKRFPEQPHPGSPNLMAGFQWSSQDGEGERLERGERKQGNASEVRRGFFFWPGTPCFVRLPPARCHFAEAGALTEKWEVSLCLILAVAASAPRDPAAPPPPRQL